MADEAGQSDTTEETSAETSASTETSSTQVNESFVNLDGSLKEGWQAALIPEDFRGRQVYNTFTDVKGLMKQVGHQAALIGRQGKGIMKPADDATETEVDLFYESLGRPKTSEEYTFEPPEGLESHYDNAVLLEAKAAMHKAGLTQKQVDVVMALDVKRLQSATQQREAAQVAQRKASEAALIQKWGAAYSERLAMANRVVAENVPDQDKHALLEIIGNNPVVAEFLAEIGSKFKEGGLIQSDTAAAARTPVEAENEMKELMQKMINEPNMRWEKPAQFARMNKEIDRLTVESLTTAGESRT